MNTYTWKLSKEKLNNTNLYLYSNFIKQVFKIDTQNDFNKIWKWSVENPQNFWKSIWDFTKVKGKLGNILLQESDIFFKNRFFPDSKLNYVDNFLHMMFSERQEDYRHNSVVSDALNTLLILHADHEQNCSTSTVRMAGSSHANLFATISGHTLLEYLSFPVALLKLYFKINSCPRSHFLISVIINLTTLL